GQPVLAASTTTRALSLSARASLARPAGAVSLSLSSGSTLASLSHSTTLRSSSKQSQCRGPVPYAVLIKSSARLLAINKGVPLVAKDMIRVTGNLYVDRILYSLITFNNTFYRLLRSPPCCLLNRLQPRPPGLQRCLQKPKPPPFPPINRFIIVMSRLVTSGCSTAKRGILVRRSFCCCMASQRHRICGARLLRRWQAGTTLLPPICLHSDSPNLPSGASMNIPLPISQKRL